MVAVLMRTEGHYYFDLMNEISSRLRDAGLFPVLISIPPEENPGIELGHIEEAVAMGCRRIIIQAELQHWSDPAFKKLGILGAGKTPFDRIVWFANTDKLPEFQKGVLVGVDARNAMRIQIRHLKNLGHRRIAYVTNEVSQGRKYPEIESYWIFLFSAVMAELGLANGISVIAQGNDLEENNRQMEAILNKADRPTAFLGAGDYRVAIAAELARRLGISIPEDLALVGSFDTPWAGHYKLTSLSYNIEGMAKAVVEEITKALASADGSRRFVEPKLVVRESSGARRK
jgi:DNA-binding LacI/PurR family transcriptional regulator